MGQKINPFGYRLGITENHRSKWFSDSNKVGERYRDFVLEDDAIRKAMSKDLERAGVSRIVIERTRDIGGTGVLYSLRTKKAADDIGAKRRVRLNRSAHRYLPLHWMLYWDRV